MFPVHTVIDIIDLFSIKFTVGGTDKVVVALGLRCVTHLCSPFRVQAQDLRDLTVILENKYLALLSDEIPVKELAGSNALS